MALSKPIQGSATSAKAAESKSSVITGTVLIDSLKRLNPRSLIGNPVMFLVEVTFFIVLAMAIYPQAFYPVASLTQDHST